MHEIWIAIVQGIVEGFTEFLPVSSTGHLILTGHLLHFTGEDANTFDIIIQLGAILAVLVLYWRRVLRLFGIGRAAKQESGPQMSLIHIIIAIVPVLILGFILKDVVDKLFSPITVLIGLVVGGIFMIIAEKQKPAKQIDDLDHMTYRQAFFIGISQCLSLWPGFSRSGATIAGGMLGGANRAVSAEFSFIISIPVMIAATGYELLKNYHSIVSGSLSFFLVGFIISFVVALLAVVTFIRLVQRLKLTYFSYYRFIIALLFIIYMWITGF